MKTIDLSFFGEGVKFDHIGLAVQCIDNVVNGVEKFTDSKQEVTVAFARLHGIQIEFVEPLIDESPVTEALKKGQKLLHICFRTPDIEASLREGRKNGFHCIARLVPALAFNNKRIAWLYSRNYGLVELVEEYGV